MEIVLEEGAFIEGYGKGITIWNINIAINDISNYQPDSKILVNIKMELSNQTSIIEVTQLVNYIDIIIGTPNLLPLKGELFFEGSSEDVRILQYQVKVYYMIKV